MDKKPLLIDEWSSVSCNLIEENSGNTKIVAKGQFAFSDIPTANKRVYQRKLWEREVDKKKPMIEDKKVYGELDHPADGKTKLERVSHLVTRLEVKPNGEIYGEADVMDTQKGKDLKAILKSGGKVGVSSRGFGTTRPDGKGNEIVQEDYGLVTFDFVADPAVASSYPEFTAEDIDQDKKQKNDDTGGRQMDIKELTDKYPELVAQIVKESQERLKAEGKEEQEKQIKEGLKKDFEKKLTETVQSAKESIREELKSEMMSDPAVAGAKLVLENISQQLLPFMLPDDVKGLLKKKDNDFANLKQELEKSVEEEKKKYEELKSEHDELATVSKKIGYEYYLEQRLKDEEHADSIRSALGDVTRFNELKDLDEALEEAIIAAKEVHEKEEERDKEITKLKEENEQLRRDIQEAFNVGKGLALRVYLERKVDNDPQRVKIRKIVEEGINKGVISNNEQIDDIIVSYKKDNPVGSELNQVQSALKSGRESKNNDGSNGKNNLSEANILGVDMRVLRGLSGIND
jgi:hypothetical protein